MQADKAKLRARYRKKRREIPEADRGRSNQAINEALETLVRERKAKRIAAFLAFDGEPDIAPALRRVADRGVEVFLPAVGEGSGGPGLVFRQWQPVDNVDGDMNLRRNPLGTLEPRDGAERAVGGFDIVFFPLVAWDEAGGRLGMGAGFYDLAFAGRVRQRRPLRAGVAFEIQRAPAIPAGAHDIRLHGVLTEAGWFTCPA